MAMLYVGMDRGMERWEDRSQNPPLVLWRDPKTEQWTDNIQGGLASPDIPAPGTAAFTSPGAVPVQPGLEWQLEQERLAVQKYIADQSAALQRDLTAINNAHDARMRQIDAGLQRELQAGRIDADKYMQARELAQRESEFARDIAFRTIQADRSFAINQAQLHLQEMAERRMERALQAQLAANPADTVEYEFYKRGLGRPEAYNLTQQFLGGQQAPQGVAVAGQNVPENLLGQPYLEAPPAYSDQSLQTLAASVMSPDGKSLYNPNLRGTGAFGAEIAAPNEMSRAEFLGLDPTQLGVLQSFLKGGIEIAPGKRVAVNPADWFQQAEASFIPTVETARTRYA